MPEVNLLKDTLEVESGGETYEFRIPSYEDEIRVGVREKNIRRSIESAMGGDVTGGAEGLDNGTYFMIHTAATFECLLKSSSAKWPFSPNSAGHPVVDYTKWPKDKVTVALSVGMAYATELSRFRDGGVSDGNGVGGEVVESEPNP